ncbi:chromosome partitioning protein ParB, partial [Pseudomonas aeruginosa]|nr:chromosome partitioning protein ParB [Pseudomonas aeruginosa]
DAYRQAGGGIRRDLFAEGDAGTYLTDTAVLETLVRDKLATLAEDVRAEGWAWVEAVPHLAYEERQAFQNAPRQRREPTTREARRIASLQTRLDKIDAELEEACQGESSEDEAKAEKLEQRRDQVVGELQDAEDALQGYAPEVREVAGAIVTIDRNGEAVIHRGLLREAEAKALRTLEKLRRGFGSTEGEAANDEHEDADDAPKAASLS